VRDIIAEKRNTFFRASVHVSVLYIFEFNFDFNSTILNSLKIFQHVTKEEDPFVPTCQDLAGFWDMVHIQVCENRYRILKSFMRSRYAHSSVCVKNKFFVPQVKKWDSD
jgi:hypothetical protein